MKKYKYSYKSIQTIKYNQSSYCNAKGVNINELFKMDKGEKGEYYIFKCLNKIKDTNYKLVDLYIPIFNENTVQIDLILIHPTGIYIIECKNISGDVYGDNFTEYWYIIYKNSKSFKMYNPILQNNTHINAVKYILPNIHTSYFKSLIIIGNQTTKLENIYLDSSLFKYETHIFKRYNLYKPISNLLQNSPQVLSISDMTKIYNKLSNYTKVSDNIKSKHIYNIINTNKKA